MRQILILYTSHIKINTFSLFAISDFSSIPRFLLLMALISCFAVYRMIHIPCIHILASILPGGESGGDRAVKAVPFHL